MLLLGVKWQPLCFVFVRGQLRGLFLFLQNVFGFLEKGNAADMHNLITFI